MRDFRKIKVWEKAHKLTLRLYDVTAKFPKEELYGLTSQIRRAAASIPGNLQREQGAIPKLSWHGLFIWEEDRQMSLSTTCFWPKI